MRRALADADAAAFVGGVVADGDITRSACPSSMNKAPPRRVSPSRCRCRRRGSAGDQRLCACGHVEEHAGAVGGDVGDRRPGTLEGQVDGQCLLGDDVGALAGGDGGAGVDRTRERGGEVGRRCRRETWPASKVVPSQSLSDPSPEDVGCAGVGVGVGVVVVAVRRHVVVGALAGDDGLGVHDHHPSK